MSQYPQHRISVTDDLRDGAAVSADLTRKGIPLDGAEAQSVKLINLGAPITADADGISASQSITPPALGLINGALASGGVVVFDVPRNVVAAWTGAAVLTVTGKDQYGVTLVEASASGTALVGLKAFKQITQISVSAPVTLFTAGSGDVLGLPYSVVVGGYLGAILNENTADAAVYVPPSRVAATATTGDVRGTIDPVAAVNGTNVFKVRVAIQNGPNNSDAFGVTQFGG